MESKITLTRKFSEKNFQLYTISNSSFDAQKTTEDNCIDGEMFMELISNKIDDAKNSTSEKFAYAVGDYLRLPKLYGADGFDTEKLTNETMRNWSGHIYPESVVHRYYKAAASECGNQEAKIIPNILRETVDQFIDTLTDKSTLKTLMLDDDVILIHLRIGDIGDVDKSILFKLRNLKLRHTKVIVLAGVHSAWMHSSMAWGIDEPTAKRRAYENSRTSFKQLHQFLGSFDWLVCDPDLAMCAAYLAKNLFVHRGGFSAALGLLSSGKIYATEKLEHFQSWQKKKWTTWEESLSAESSLEIL